MSRVRVLGPREALSKTLEALQDLGLVHLSAPASRGSLTTAALEPRQLRLERQLKRILDDVKAATALLGAEELRTSAPHPPAPWGRAARLARQVRREAERLQTRNRALEEERALLAKYQDVMAVFGKLFERGVAPGLRAYLVVLRAGQLGSVERLRTLLDGSLGRDFELRTHPLPSGELVLLLLVPLSNAPRVERLLGESGVEQVPLPRGYEGQSLADAVPHILERLHAIPGELEDVAKARAQLRQRLPELAEASAAVHDRLSQLEGLRLSASTPHAFVLEGWVPATEVRRLTTRLTETVGPSVSVEELAAEHWTAEAPVVLHNPRLFRPFELLVGMLPLPRYGTIDPTPFVAVFFPMFFGLMVGDVGYGLVLAAGGTALAAPLAAGAPRCGPSPKSRWACALFTCIFGVLFGEFFGDLGRHWFGMRPLVLDREEPRDIVSFLGLCIALGLVHIVLGLVLGVVSAFRGHPRQAIGRGLSALMVLLITGALLAAFRVLPHRLLTPAGGGAARRLPAAHHRRGAGRPGRVALHARQHPLLRPHHGARHRLGHAGGGGQRTRRRDGQRGGGRPLRAAFPPRQLRTCLVQPRPSTDSGCSTWSSSARFYSPGGVQYRPFRHWRNT